MKIVIKFNDIEIYFFYCISYNYGSLDDTSLIYIKLTIMLNCAKIKLVAVILCKERMILYDNIRNV